MNYYNEFDPFAARWLQILIDEGLIPPGYIDTRSIVDVQPGDLGGFTQCHFFAGIGGWSYALQLAGWPADVPVWTGSCPCQPFSTAGKRQGEKDARHLWPEFARLIGQCNPPIVFGEQVASKAGRVWLAGVRADLEGMGYAVGAADLCAAGIGAPHIRQRLYWGGVADPSSVRRQQRREASALEVQGECPERSGEYEEPRDAGELAGGLKGLRRNGSGAGHPEQSRLEGLAWDEHDRGQPGWVSAESNRFTTSTSVWSDSDIVYCTDGKFRRVKPRVLLLAHGTPNRVGRLRGIGNAIVPPLAAEFIQAYEEALSPSVLER